MQQKVYEVNDEYAILDDWLREQQIKTVLIVSGQSIRHQKINEYLEELPTRLNIKVVHFMGFQPNPLYENVLDGLRVFRAEGCGAIIAIGGGSAMDVAKCIKLYSNMDGDGENGAYLKQAIVPNDIPFLAIPTTSGTGSEATRYAVIYYKGKKQSVMDDSCIPGTVLLDCSMIKTLPVYQKKATMLDALCHAIESYWSVNSCEESRKLSREAIESILRYKQEYFANSDIGNAGMLRAANTAGKAINLTQTTAGHAMCYKITSIFGCAHGHAAALCDRVLFPWMIDNVEKCCDPRGADFLRRMLNEIGEAMGCIDARSGAQRFSEIFQELSLEIPDATSEQFTELKTSVNSVRLRNHPIALDEETIDQLYHAILR